MKHITDISKSFLRNHWILFIGLVLTILWCLPYLTTGHRLEWGDFSFFAQGYEAMRISILQYGQFPWWNPWMAGGIPLYANPQMGVFSIQTVFVLIFGTVDGLKIAVSFYTVVGYLSMYLLLNKYFKVRPYLAAPLSVAWIASSFFVSHLPSHFTFVWYLLVPLFVYTSLTVKTWKGGVVLGLLFAIMALSAVHNPFFQIALACGGILAFRFGYILWKRSWDTKKYIAMLGIAAVTFITLAGHRMFLAYQNVSGFSRPTPEDPSLSIFNAPYAVFMPFQRSGYVDGSIIYPVAPFSWGEATSSGGIALTILFFIVLAVIVYLYIRIRRNIQPRSHRILTYAIPLIAIFLFFFVLGIGNFATLSPYNFLKHLPVFGEMRVSTRWFLWATLAMITIVGIMLSYVKKYRPVAFIAVCLIVVELFALNYGYQRDVLSKNAVEAPSKTSSYSFRQIDQFGSTYEFDDGLRIPNDGVGPTFYREYEATTFNIGLVRANEPLVNNRYEGVRCVEDNGCPYILSGNAKLIEWTPNKIILERTGDGEVVVNINATRYAVINGERIQTKKVGDTKANIVINDTSSLLTITYSPEFRR